MRRNRLFQSFIACFLIGLTLLGLGEGRSYGASATAQCLATVVASLDIAKLRDLNFGLSSVGDKAVTVAPSESDSRAATFQVRGEANRSYSIALPADGSVTLLPGDASSSSQNGIPVTGFTSYPAKQGSLSATGEQVLHVGATRGEIGKDIIPGQYRASFSVTVVY